MFCNGQRNRLKVLTVITWNVVAVLINFLSAYLHFVRKAQVSQCRDRAHRPISLTGRAHEPGTGAV